MKTSITHKINSPTSSGEIMVKEAAPSPKKAASVSTKSKVSANKDIKKVVAKQVSKAGEMIKQASPKKMAKGAVTFDKDITEKLKKIVANYTEYPELLNSIERDTKKSFIDELNIDSVDFVEIIVDVEEVFGISITDDEIYDLKSFEDLYVAIDSKIVKTRKV